MKLSVLVPIKTTNPNNGQVGNSKLAGIIRAKHRRNQRGAVFNALFFQVRGLPELPVVVTLTRIAPSNGLDPHDGLRAALKGPVDGVADWLGLKSDRDHRVSWRYAQRRGRPREYAVEITVEAAGVKARRTA